MFTLLIWDVFELLRRCRHRTFPRADHVRSLRNPSLYLARPAFCTVFTDLKLKHVHATFYIEKVSLSSLRASAPSKPPREVCPYASSILCLHAAFSMERKDARKEYTTCLHFFLHWRIIVFGPIAMF